MPLRARLARLVPLIVCASTVLGSLRVEAQGIDVAINEIHYHPGDDLRESEFIELVNFGEVDISLQNWKLDGAVRFTFPDGLTLAAGEYIVVAADAQRFLDRYDVPLGRLGGVYAGALDNDGERIDLVDDRGFLVSRIRYDDTDPWPESADGLGPSLERIDPRFEDEDPAAWAPSLAVGGSPGARNSVRRPDPPRTVHSTLVPRSATWRYFKGEQAPPPDWAQPDFDDAGWLEGEAGFGYGDGDDATVLDDMEDSYLTVFIRTGFELESAASVDRLVLEVNFDDGFFAYLNGVEIERRNVDSADFDAAARNGHEAGSFESFELSDPALLALLRDGANVLALQGHNSRLGSGDLSLHPALSAERQEHGDDPAVVPTRPPRDLVVNELAVGGAGTGWIELFNPTASTVDLSGRHLRLEPPWRGDFVFAAAGPSLAGGERLVLTEFELGFELDGIHALILTSGEGYWIDALNPRSAASGYSSGRFPDGDDNRFVFPTPTPGGANVAPPVPSIVINEIQYHPADENPGGEFIELLNAAGEAVDLGGWKITRGFDYTFPAGTIIAPGDHVVVARDPQAVAAHYGIGGVLGPYEGRLRNDAETILLRDVLGNPVDRVRYADEGSWPEETDGLGPSIELVHPRLENRYGPAWRSSAGEGTPGAANSSLADDPPPVIVAVQHAPLIPSPTDDVHVLATASDEQGIELVTLFYVQYDGGNEEPTPVEMLDDGEQDDGVAGNGVYGAFVPAQPEGTLVGFWIEATAAGDQQVSAPPDPPDRTFLFLCETPPEFPRLRPTYRILMPPDRLEHFRNRSTGSDTLLDVTFIGDGEAYYNRGVRLRGSSARSCQPRSYRVQFDHDRSFHGIKRLNLNGCNANQQWIGLDFLRRTGIPTPDAWFRTIAFNDELDDDVRLRVEAIDGEFLERHLGGDDGGNLYRGISRANLDYRGEDFDDYRGHYRKETNKLADDYSDIVELCFRFDSATTEDAEFPAAIEEVIDTDQWALYFAAYAVLGSTENSIVLNNGDDYFLYNRPSDGRWILLPWDLDSCFDQENQELFRPTVDAIERFLEHPRYAPDYWCHLERLTRDAFRRDDVLARIERLSGLFSPARLDFLRSYVEPRRDYVLPRFHPRLTLETDAGASVCEATIFSTELEISVSGDAPTCGTSSVTVNGVAATYDPLSARWAANVDFAPGDPLSVVARDRDGVEIERLDLSMESGSEPSFTDLPLDISLDTVISRSGSPYRAGNNVVVQPGATLTIEAGVTIAFDADASLLVDGTLVAEGSADEPVVLHSDDCGERWEGIALRPGSGSHLLSRVVVRDASAAEGYGDPFVVDSADVVIEASDLEANVDGPSLRVMQGGDATLQDLQLQGGRTLVEFAGGGGSIVSSRFGGFTAPVVRVRGPSAVPVHVQDTIFEHCATGMHLLEGAAALADHLTLHGCEVGILLDPTGGDVSFEAHSIIAWQSGQSIADLQGDALDLTFSNTDGGVRAGEGNISRDPRFVDAAAGDYSLRLRSPCRAAGRDGTDMGAVPYVPSGDTSSFVRCDANSDGTLDIGDAAFTLFHLFVGNVTPRCRAAGDCNADAQLDLSDSVFTLAYLFLGGAPPAPPFPDCDVEAIEECFDSTCPSP